MLLTSWNNLIETFDFDRCTGDLSNPIIIEPENPGGQTGSHFGSCFSPNQNIIYVTHNVDGSNQTDSRLYQYNLNAPNIALSRDTLYHWVFPDIAGRVRLAPDDKVYLSTAYVCASPPTCFPYPDSIYNQTNMNLSVINRPDSLGDSCLFTPYSFYLGGKRTYYGLPNNPDYEMSPLVGSGCDSLPLDVVPSLEIKKELKIFYHSGWQTAFINASSIQGKNYSLSIFDITGKQLFYEQGKLSSQYFTKDLHCNFANGIFIVSFSTDKEKLISRFIIQ